MSTMIEITQKKIASLIPTWSVFRGSSILFSEIGEARTVEGDSGCDFFSDLARYSFLLSTDPWRSKFGFCPLPPESYHVTLADLINDGNFHQVPAPVRWQFGRDHVTVGKEYPPLLAQAVTLCRLGSISPINFQVDDVVILNQSALAITLKPADPDKFHHLLGVRSHLAQILEKEFAVKLQSYSPHITLGYFANKSCAIMAADLVKALAADLILAMSARSFNFSRPAPFRFSSMARFLPIWDD